MKTLISFVTILGLSMGCSTAEQHHDVETKPVVETLKADLGQFTRWRISYGQTRILNPAFGYEFQLGEAGFKCKIDHRLKAFQPKDNPKRYLTCVKGSARVQMMVSCKKRVTDRNHMALLDASKKATPTVLLMSCDRTDDAKLVAKVTSNQLKGEKKAPKKVALGTKAKNVKAPAKQDVKKPIVKKSTTKKPRPVVQKQKAKNPTVSKTAPVKKVKAPASK